MSSGGNIERIKTYSLICYERFLSNQNISAAKEIAFRASPGIQRSVQYGSEDGWRTQAAERL